MKRHPGLEKEAEKRKELKMIGIERIKIIRRRSEIKRIRKIEGIEETIVE